MLKYGAALGLFLLLFLVGFKKKQMDQWIANKMDQKSSFAYNPSNYSFSFNFASPAKIPYKWVSTLLFTFLYGFLSTAIIYTLFFPKPFWKTNLLAHLFLISLCTFFIIVGSIFPRISFAIEMAQDLKKLIQGPIFTFLMIIYFWKIRSKVVQNK